MRSECITQHLVSPACKLIDLIDTDQIVGLSRFTIEHADDDCDSKMQTLALGIPADSSPAFPVVVIDIHASDDAAMKYSVAVFEALKRKGRISSDQAAKYRRALMTLVPHEII